MIEFSSVPVEKPAEINCIIGQSHFIKTVEDIYEALIQAVPGIRFGLAFSEASGACKIRCEGTDGELRKLAAGNAERIAAGHSFIIMLKDVYPINVLTAVKNVSEVCTVFCATANPVEVVIARTPNGRGIMGVIDGSPPQGVEEAEDVAWRKGLLRTIGYKL